MRCVNPTRCRAPVVRSRASGETLNKANNGTLDQTMRWGLRQLVSTEISGSMRTCSDLQQRNDFAEFAA